MKWSVSLPAGVQRLAPRLIHATARLTRPLTIGVRAVILDESDAGGNTKVFLVRHSYVPGWHLPGGAVEAGETVLEALVRETREECAIAIAQDAPRLFGLYFNRRLSRRDHVAGYVARDFRVLSEREPDWEILEARFHTVTALPEGTATAARARLAEVLNGQAQASDW